MFINTHNICGCVNVINLSFVIYSDSAYNTLMLRGITLSLLVLIFLVSCKPLPMYGLAPEGPQAYQDGFNDGCDTGVSIEGDFYQKMFYNITKDPDQFDSSLYKRGWNEGYNYCRSYMASLRDSGPLGGDGGWFGYK